MKARDEKEIGYCETGFAQLKKRLAVGLRQIADRMRLPHDHDKDVSPNELSRIAFQARSWIEDAAAYVEQADSEKIKNEASAAVRRNPGTSLLVSVSAGLILGAIVRRR
jgi:ElaB/YqjD/DUF883 family membrane-anchored ribosome-binding protein